MYAVVYKGQPARFENKGVYITADASITWYGDASGGIVKYVDDYKIHEFDSSGTFEVLRLTPFYPKTLDVSILIVGGGGSGNYGGGGGGGQIIITTLGLDIGSYQITIGKSDQDSSCFGLIANKGLPGKTMDYDGGNSGSGMIGGNGNYDKNGGGAGDTENGGNARWTAGYGGHGQTLTFDGSTRSFGGGGGGGSSSTTSTRSYGYDGGGNGGYLGVLSTAGTANTGGGGGGDHAGYGSGSPGGTGVVIIKYRYK